MSSKPWWLMTVALAAALTACGESPPGGPVSSSTTTSITSAPTTPSEPLMTLRGVVQEGVEAGCRVLTTDSGQYLLLAGEGVVVPMGTEVVVEGRLATDLVSYCQQGTPFAVTKVEPA
ncbi:hypothetical protein [Actinokineospora sp.]|uniref:hypothetical protein n=1 Tax=Actinokineospora sp. TaxID=1872133 RepID=UPI003D6B5059